MNSQKLKLFISSLIFCLLTSVPAVSGDNNFPQSIIHEDIRLELNGDGVRKMFFKNIYRSGLYLLLPNDNAVEILNEDTPMAVRLEVSTEMLTSERIKGAFEVALDRSTNGNTKPIASHISKFMAVFNQTVSTGDVFDFIYLPTSGTNVLKNSVPIDVVPGFEFKKAFFGVFLSDNPVQKSLKEAMLGR